LSNAHESEALVAALQRCAAVGRTPVYRLFGSYYEQLPLFPDVAPLRPLLQAGCFEKSDPKLLYYRRNF
jgi:hypothetical protein